MNCDPDDPQTGEKLPDTDDYVNNSEIRLKSVSLSPRKSCLHHDHCTAPMTNHVITCTVRRIAKKRPLLRRVFNVLRNYPHSIYFPKKSNSIALP